MLFNKATIECMLCINNGEIGVDYSLFVSVVKMMTGRVVGDSDLANPEFWPWLRQKNLRCLNQLLSANLDKDILFELRIDSLMEIKKMLKDGIITITRTSKLAQMRKSHFSPVELSH